jgi:hypothetical protein
MTTGRINQVAIVPESRKTLKLKVFCLSSRAAKRETNSYEQFTHSAARRSKPEFNQQAIKDHDPMYLKINTRDAHHNQPVVRIQLDEIHVNTARHHNQRKSLAR